MYISNLFQSSFIQLISRIIWGSLAALSIHHSLVLCDAIGGPSYVLITDVVQRLFAPTHSSFPAVSQKLISKSLCNKSPEYWILHHKSRSSLSTFVLCPEYIKCPHKVSSNTLSLLVHHKILLNSTRELFFPQSGTYVQEYTLLLPTSSTEFIGQKWWNRNRTVKEAFPEKENYKLSNWQL